MITLFLLFISYSKARRIIDAPSNKRQNNTTLGCPYDRPRTTPDSRDRQLSPFSWQCLCCQRQWGRMVRAMHRPLLTRLCALLNAQQARALIAPHSPLLLFDYSTMIHNSLFLPLAMVGDHSNRQECVSSILHHDGETV